MNHKSIELRRAEFVYEAARLAALAARAPIVPNPFARREKDFREQFIEVVTRECGLEQFTSPEEAHKSWMQAYLANGWVYGEKYDQEHRTHPDLVPFEELPKAERDKDAVFIVLCNIAKVYIE